LAHHHGVATRAVSYHDHNEEARTPELIERLRAGDDVALVSDAGTPLVSDPGYRLVRAAIEAGIVVTAIPGPSAVTAAIAASGLPPHPFRFLGFLPRTSAARRAVLEAVQADEATLVAFEAPRRLTDALRDARAVLGDRPACLARNLTKLHERYQRGPLSQLVSELGTEGEVRGECTIVIGGGAGRPPVSDEAEADARLLLEGGAPARIVQELLQRRHGLSRREAYALVVRIRDR
jgi:16S rRNA (cytidine1402-2'-O)-methyltransferase